MEHDPHSDAERRNAGLDPKRERERRTSILILRVVFYVLVISVMVVNFVRVGPDATSWELSLATGGWWAVALAVALASAVLAIDLLTPRKKVSTLSGVFLGLLAGVLAAIAVSFLLDLLAQGYALEGTRLITTLKILIGVCFCYLGVSVVLQTQDDFRLVIPYVEFAKQIRGQRPMLLDTSALIDGRVLDLGATGMVQAPVVIPRFVIEELQRLADSSDRTKRARGRRGLDMVARLQREPRLDLSIDERAMPGVNVDQMLIEMAREQHAIIITTDSGLARVAGIQSVPVINMHDVANAMRTTVVTGESMRLLVVKGGEQPGQGVGYLDDGAMVVVENGGSLIGQEANVVVTGTLQTSAGRLIFARAHGVGEEHDHDAESGRDGAAPTDSAGAADPGGAAREEHGGVREPPRGSARRSAARNPRR